MRYEDLSQEDLVKLHNELVARWYVLDAKITELKNQAGICDDEDLDISKLRPQKFEQSKKINTWSYNCRRRWISENSASLDRNPPYDKIIETVETENTSRNLTDLKSEQTSIMVERPINIRKIQMSNTQTVRAKSESVTMTPKKVRRVRELAAKGVSNPQIAERLNISRYTAYRINTRQSYNWVD